MPCATRVAIDSQVLRRLAALGLVLLGGCERPGPFAATAGEIEIVVFGFPLGAGIVVTEYIQDRIAPWEPANPQDQKGQMPGLG